MRNINSFKMVDILIRRYRSGTQKRKVLAHLALGHRLSQFDAERFWGVRRLAARISEIRDDLWENTGYDIKATTQYVDDERFTSYTLIPRVS